MMRLSALMTISALGVLCSLTVEHAPGSWSASPFNSGPRITVRATTTQVVLAGHSVLRYLLETINPEQAQASMIVIGYRPMGPFPR